MKVFPLTLCQKVLLLYYNVQASFTSLIFHTTLIQHQRVVMLEAFVYASCAHLPLPTYETWTYENCFRRRICKTTIVVDF